MGLLQAEAQETKGKAVEAEKATDDDQALADDDVLAGGTGAGVAAAETRLESGPLADDGEAALKEKGRLIDEEERNTGEVKGSVYLEYMRSTGGLGLLTLLVLSSLLFQVRASGLAPKKCFGARVTQPISGDRRGHAGSESLRPSVAVAVVRLEW